MELISKRGKDNYWEYGEGRCVYALGHGLMDQLDTYEKDDLPEAPYFNFKLKKSMNFSVIRSDKSSKHDSKATDNDLRDIRTALTNLITHTGGIAITFDVANINGDQYLSLATPSIAVPEIWDQGIRALRARNKPPKKDEFKAEVHNEVKRSLDQSIAHPVKSIIHSIPDVNP
jgi:hypothetical protein